MQGAFSLPLWEDDMLQLLQHVRKVQVAVLLRLRNAGIRELPRQVLGLQTEVLRCFQNVSVC